MINDVRYILRRIRRQSTISIVVVATVALGIGLGITALSAADALILRLPDGISRPEHVSRLYIHYQSLSGAPFERGTQASVPDVADVRESTAEVADVAAYFLQRLSARLATGHEQLIVALVTDNYFRALGSRQQVGRFLDTTDAHWGNTPRAVISDRLWHRVYGGRREAVGQQLVLNGRQFEIIGVAQRHFRGLSEATPDVWIPLAQAAGVNGIGAGLTSRETALLQVFARTRPDISAAQLQASVRAAIARVEVDQPLRYWRRSVTIGRVTDPETLANDGERTALATASAALGGIVILLVSMVSANLALASTVARNRELAIRMALGGSPAGVARLVALEVLMLAAIGGFIGGGLATVFGDMLRLPIPDQPPLVLDHRFIGISIVCATFSGLVACALPMYSVLRRNPASAFRPSGATADKAWSRFSAILVVAGIVGSVVLLTGAGLFALSFLRASHVSLGLEPKGLIVASVSLASRMEVERDPSSLPSRSQAFFSEAARRLRETPGTASVTLATGEPFSKMTMSNISIDGVTDNAAQSTLVMSDMVGPDYFSTLGLRIVRGRPFDQGDYHSLAENVVVNETMARTYWPGGDPLGKCIRLQSEPNPRCLLVIGIVEDARVVSVREKPPSICYIPMGAGSYPPDLALFIRVRGSERSAIRTVQRVLQDLRGDLPKIAVQSMEDVLAPQLRPWRYAAVLFGAAAILTVVIAAVSLYALLSYLVARRTSEFGVRLALGAQPADITRLVVARGAALAGFGVLGGIILALLFMRPLQPLLYEVSYTDIRIYLGTAILLTATAVSASYLPTRRAGLIDPATALREE